MVESFPNGTRAALLSLCERIQEHIAPPQKRIKLGIVIGHNSVSKGAYSPHLLAYEYDFNKEQAKHFIDAARETVVDAQVFERTPVTGGHKQEIRNVYRETDEWGADYTIELHFNSFDKPTASGTLTLHAGTSQGQGFATIVQGAMVRTLRLPDRGTSDLMPDDRGYCSVISGRAPAALIEPGFGSNPTDSQVIRDGYRAMAGAIVREIEALS